MTLFNSFPKDIEINIYSFIGPQFKRTQSIEYIRYNMLVLLLISIAHNDRYMMQRNYLTDLIKSHHVKHAILSVEKKYEELALHIINSQKVIKEETLKLQSYYYEKSRAVEMMDELTRI